MPDSLNRLAQIAAINLHFAQVEIAAPPDQDGVARAIYHVEQAEEYLRLLAKEIGAEIDEI